MSTARRLREQERAVIVAMLQGHPEATQLLDSLEGALVEEMSDGGMGSLKLIPKGLRGGARSFGAQIALGEFRDSDGVEVSVALNVDREGRLFELDFWKVSFAPLRCWPKSSAIRIVR